MAIPPVRLDPWQNVTAVSWGNPMDCLLLIRVQFKSSDEPSEYHVRTRELRLNDSRLSMTISNREFGGRPLAVSVPTWQAFVTTESIICGEFSEWARAINPAENDGFDRETVQIWDTAKIRSDSPYNGATFEFGSVISLMDGSPAVLGNTADCRVIVEALFGDGLTYSISNGTVYWPILRTGDETSKTGRYNIVTAGVPIITTLAQKDYQIQSLNTTPFPVYLTLWVSVMVNTLSQEVKIRQYDPRLSDGITYLE